MRRTAAAALWLSGVLAFAVIGQTVFERVTYFSMTGRWFPITRIDALNNPQKVVGWDSTGLRLASGAHLLPTGVLALPRESETVRIATANGVEVAPDGHVFCLVKLHHGCGNDPIRRDLRRIDLAHLLAYQDEGRSAIPLGRHARVSFVSAGGGSQYGWDYSSFVAMGWAIKDAEGSTPSHRPTR